MKSKIKDYLYLIILVLIFALGIFMRTRMYYINNLFEDDECRLIITLLSHRWWEMFLSLGDAQSAPPIFALASKMIGNFTGYNEYGMKFIPYLAGIGSLFLFYKLCKSYLKTRIAILVGMLALAVSGPLIYRASNFKQYSLDAFITILCLYLFPKIKIKELDTKQFILLSLGLIILPFVSLTSVFFIGAFLIINIIENIKDKKFYIKLFSFLIPFCIIMGLYYFFNLAPSKINLNEVFPHYWDNGYFDFALKDFIRIFAFNTACLLYPNEIILPAIILVFWGILIFIREKTRNSYMILLSFTLILLASLLHIYPWVSRVAVYSIPLLLILLAKPFETKRKLEISAIIVLLFLSFFKYDLNYFKNEFDELLVYSPKNIVINLKERYNPQADIILINESSASSYLFYSSKLNFNNDNVYIFGSQESAIRNITKELDNFNKNQNIWIVLIKDYKADRVYPQVFEWLENKKVTYKYNDKNSYLFYVEN